jgi:hypothetical protein
VADLSQTRNKAWQYSKKKIYSSGTTTSSSCCANQRCKYATQWLHTIDLGSLLLRGDCRGEQNNEVQNYWNRVLLKKVQARNYSTALAARTRTELPELIQTMLIRLTKICNTPLNGNEWNSIDSQGRNSSTNRVSTPELNSSNRNSGTVDTQTESCWQCYLWNLMTWLLDNRVTCNWLYSNCLCRVWGMRGSSNHIIS